MKMKISAFLVLLAFAGPAWSQDVGVIVGVRSDSADSESSAVTISSKTGFQAGLVGKFDLSAPLQLRSGLIYNSRSYGYSTSSPVAVNADTKLTYFEIPVGLLYKFSDYGGVFVGGAVNLNLSKDCAGGSCNSADVNSSPLALQIGGSFKIAPQIGFELYYEMMTSQMAKEIKNPRAIVANLMITFD